MVISVKLRTPGLDRSSAMELTSSQCIKVYCLTTVRVHWVTGVCMGLTEVCTVFTSTPSPSEGRACRCAEAAVRQ